MSSRTCLLGSLLGVTLSLPALGATSLGDNFTFSGFGTLGGVVTDDDAAQYVRPGEARGAGTGGALMVDSNLGLQLDAKATSWLSATVQTLTKQRSDPRLSTRIEWAYVKVDPIEDLSLHFGRFLLPTFLISDSREIGYANTWLRPADEVYGLERLNQPASGAEATYRLKVFGQQISFTGVAGTMVLNDRYEGKLGVHDIRGGNVSWDGDWFTFRLGSVAGTAQLSSQVLAYYPGSEPRYTFNDAGLSIDRANIVVQAEYVQRRAGRFTFGLGSNGWYVLGGYRFGSWLPYIEQAAATPTRNGIAASQTTTALGVRWDAFRSAAIKFQAARVNTHGTTGISFITPPDTAVPVPNVFDPVTRPVTTLSAAVDFVF